MSLVSLLAALLVAAEPPGAFDEIVEWAKSHSHHEAIDRMGAWWEANPTDPRGGRAVIWLGQLYVTDAKPEEARKWFERARSNYPKTEWALHAIRSIAGLDASSWHFDEARRGYQQLIDSRDPFFVFEGETGLYVVTRLERQIYGVFGLTFFVVATLIWLLVKSKGLWQLLPPPMEFMTALPILALMAFGALAQRGHQAAALLAVACGGGVLLWANGAAFRAKPPLGWRRYAAALFGIFQAASLLYVVVVLFQLWDKLRDTITLGADA